MSELHFSAGNNVITYFNMLVKVIILNISINTTSFFMFTLTNHFTQTNQNKNGEKFHLYDMSLTKRNETILQISASVSGQVSWI